MTRFRLTMSTEWDADPAHYSEDEHEMTVVEMLAIDQKNAEDDPWGMLNCGDTKVKVVVEEITTFDKGGWLPTGATKVHVSGNKIIP